jgi:hypothetical protein
VAGGRRGRLRSTVDDLESNCGGVLSESVSPTARVDQDVRVLATGLERLLALLVELLDMLRMAGFAAVRPKGEGR